MEVQESNLCEEEVDTAAVRGKICACKGCAGYEFGRTVKEKYLCI